MDICRVVRRAFAPFGFLFLILAIPAFVASAFVGPAFAGPPPAEAFGNLPQTSDASLSPDGHHLAVIHPVAGRSQVMIFEFTPTGVQRYAFNVKDAIAERLLWAGNNRLIATYSQNIHETKDTKLRTWVRAFSMDAHGQNVARIMQSSLAGDINTSTGSIVDIAPQDPDHVYVQAWGLYPHVAINLFRADLTDGRAKAVDFGIDNARNKPQLGSRLAVRGASTENWIMDGNGNPVARLDVDEDKAQVNVMLGHRRSWHKAATLPIFTGKGRSIAGVSEDGKSLLLYQWSDAGMTELVPLDLKTAKIGQPVFSNPDYDVDGVVGDFSTGRVVGVTYETDAPHVHYFDSQLAAVQKKLEGALPGRDVGLVSWDRARDAYVVLASGPQFPPTYYLFSPATSQLTFLAPQYPALASKDLGPMKAYPYKARDGVQIHAFLTLPPGAVAHNLPAVIFPHGGPEDRDAIGFDWWTQFMASRGYAVLQPNFRGSTGYGLKYRDDGRGQWGRRSQNDITDGVKKLIADGIVDPKRICIVGASYGGYAALAGATFTPDLYACAISYAGVSDIPALIGHTAVDADHDKLLAQGLDEEVGNVYGGEDALKAVSPALHADQVRVPILLLHSDKDLTVPLVQSKIERDALIKAGKTVQMIVFPGDDHYLGFGQTRIKLLKAVETFLTAQIGPGKVH